MRSWKRRETPANGSSKRVEKEARMCIKSYDMLALEHLHVHEQGAETSFGKSNRPLCRASVRCLAAGSCMVVAAIVPGGLISVMQ